MNSRLAIITGAILLAGLLVGGTIYFYWNKAVPIVAMGINYVRYLSAPSGTLTTEVGPTKQSRVASLSTSTVSASSDKNEIANEADWPSYKNAHFKSLLATSPNQ